jgi:hypothetical protein
VKPARDYDPAKPCQLDSEKWRVRRYVVPVPKRVAVVRPWQLQSPVPALPPALTRTVAVWGIWPPQWHLESAPMLVFPVWRMAFRAAFDRAAFAHVPPQSVQPTSLNESEINGGP